MKIFKVKVEAIRYFEYEVEAESHEEAEDKGKQLFIDDHGSFFDEYHIESEQQ